MLWDQQTQCVQNEQCCPHLVGQLAYSGMSKRFSMEKDILNPPPCCAKQTPLIFPVNFISVLVPGALIFAPPRRPRFPLFLSFISARTQLRFLCLNIDHHLLSNGSGWCDVVEVIPRFAANRVAFWVKKKNACSFPSLENLVCVTAGWL